MKTKENILWIYAIGTCQELKKYQEKAKGNKIRLLGMFALEAIAINITTDINRDAGIALCLDQIVRVAGAMGGIVTDHFTKMPFDESKYLDIPFNNPGIIGKVREAYLWYKNRKNYQNVE